MKRNCSCWGCLACRAELGWQCGAGWLLGLMPKTLHLSMAVPDSQPFRAIALLESMAVSASYSMTCVSATQNLAPWMHVSA